MYLYLRVLGTASCEERTEQISSMSIASWGMRLAGSKSEVVERIESSFFTRRLQTFHIKLFFAAVTNYITEKK